MHSFTSHQYIITRIDRLITHLFTAFLATICCKRFCSPLPLPGVVKPICLKAEVHATSIMLLNGYRLPDLYLLSDLKYMLE
ncbi:hypothetical protein [Mucilaginibacter flavidus]|uniref:hypothetical protein n=1 Tax=Mucilaginibacter flavidus TaxID=2949309 RepID=UPI00209295C8|nr:hypothetical protein [Mucilaginibacter flavidus]